MGKKFFSLCMALALCLSLLPATALAAVPEGQIIYVGNESVTNGGYWTTDSNGNVTAYTGGDTPTDNYIHYDVANNTLTLHNATIKESVSTNTSTFIAGAAIGVHNQNGAAELTITLEGTNTIAEVGKGIYVLANSTGGATLTITGDGSLNASASQTGIWVQSNSGDATLTIKNAKVEATGTSTAGYGVNVQSSNSSTAALTVDGGSLTASGSPGILYDSIGTGTVPKTTALTISNSAIVDARGGGIGAGLLQDLKKVSPADDSVGIVFDNGTGTVYGDATLQENLTIGEGESLTIPDGSSLNCNEKLTNNGTILASGGTVTGSLSGGTTITTPSISQQPTGQTVTEGQGATFTVEASAGSETPTYQWQQSTDSGSNWTDISDATANSYTINSTTTSMSGNQYRCVVKSASGVSVISQAATLTVQAKPASVPVTGVKLNTETLELFTGNTATLTATVEPENATNKNVTWSTSNASVATVENGVVTAVGQSSATITVTTEDGGKTATCVVTVTAATVPVTGVTLSQTQASLYCNRTPNTLALTAKVAPDNATNKAVTWTSSDSAVATVDQNGVVTALARGTAVITATAADGSGANATCTVTVSRYSSGGGSSSSSTSLSDRAIDDIQDARPGDTVEITLRPGRTTLEREVFEELAGQDITLEIDAGDGVLWTVNGLDIPEDTRLHDLDLNVDLGDSDIPATVLNAVTGEISTVQLSLAHDGEFGFTMTLSAPLGRDNADYWANLYWFNEGTEELEFQQAARIAKDGTAEFDLDHASDYAIVIDDRSHEPVDLPFADVPEGYWAYDAIQYVYGEGLMAGTSGSTFSPEGTTTRGQIVTILWRLSGSPVVNYAMDYNDVAEGSYYAEAIRWAASEGIAGGYGGGVFGPDDPITREQLAVMLHRYAQHEGCDVSIGEDINILSYADAFTVSEYAVSALQWACGAGIISGTGDGSTLTPQGEATRAQAATVLMRFCEEYQ